MATIKRIAIGLCLSFVLLQGSALAAGQPTGYNPNGLPTAGCFWTGPFSASNPKTNIAYPGTEITYWGAKFVTPPGSTLTLKGRYPHARYSSFNAYEGDGASASSLSDRQIRPDRGSINPSLPGKNRDAKNRGYTITVRGEPLPSSPQRNTLYANPIEGSSQDILYRVYVPDRGRNLAGGTGLPKPTLRLADGTVLSGKAMCEQLNSSHDYTNNLMSPALYETLLNSPGKDPATNPALPQFGFKKFFNMQNVLAGYRDPAAQQATWAANPTPQGTQYNNNDARYMTGAYSFRFGETLAIHGRLPTTPKTLNGQKRTKAGQMVEWDLCGIQALTTTKTYRCLFDEQIPVTGKKRNFVVAVTKAELRPWNAKRKCGVAWLPADPAGDGAGRTDAGTLITRNILPSPGFKRSIWGVTSPFSAREEMGAYYPEGTYMSKKSFQSHGCPFRWK
ncbi:MAG TPA: hypothetical protein VMF31_00835 [Solirubrobacterales bacterium]|nr:hypothetical protein [Solirubrobacterales bacterium]